MNFGCPPRRAVLPDGRRQHFQHGPIDLVLEAFGPAEEIAAAYDQAWRRFRTILAELAGELPVLRRPAEEAEGLEGAVARRMLAACRRHRPAFVTPMAAVAGAVADEILATLVRGRTLARAYVNNGGDIALHLAPGESLTAGIVALAERPACGGAARLSAESPVRGIATSGWRGRSFSLGIADSVTVLAASARAADVAATLIANAVDADDPAIDRQPACALAPDSDLGARPVTVAVGRLSPSQVSRALAAGTAAAESMAARGLIVEALVSLQGQSRVVGTREVLAA